MEILKIILLYPNFKWIENWENRTMWKIHPYNLCLLSSMIDKKYDVEIVDANEDDLSREELKKIIELKKPDILGISVLSNEYSKSGFIASEIAKKVDKNIKTVFGGVSAISDPDYIINNKYVDFLVYGEGEYVFRDLCGFFCNENEFPKKGVIYKTNGKVINNGRADFIEDLDSIPLPSYHKVDFLKYANQIQRESVDRPRAMPFAHILTSRGCPFKCCFCEVGKISGMIPRCRSPKNIMNEIDYLVREYGIKAFLFDDDNLIFKKDRAKEFFKLLISRKYNLKWNALALAVYKLDEEMISLMKESGCEFVDIAIESGVERVLKKIIHKPGNLKYAKKMVELLKKYNIDVAANFVIGFPGETWNEIRQTIKFAEELGHDYSKIFIATPHPETELYRLAKAHGYLKQDYSFDKHLWTDGTIETEHFRPQDLKIIRAYEWDRVNFSDSAKKRNICRIMDVTEERLDEIRKQTFERANP